MCVTNYQFYATVGDSTQGIYLIVELVPDYRNILLCSCGMWTSEIQSVGF